MTEGDGLSIRFAVFTLASGEEAWIPADVHLALPHSAAAPPEIARRLAYIPWEQRYLDRVDPECRHFFSFVHRYLRTRTADVHVATCLPFAAELMEAEPGPIDGRVVRIAFILHDIGWSQMSQAEIAASLSVHGLALSEKALAPKLRHAELGRELAVQVLDEYRFDPPLTGAQKELIYSAILYHDRPEGLAAVGGAPASVLVVCDVDHLWSFTRENFWQDTIRKGVDPRGYVENLARDLDGYLVTVAGRCRARAMLEDRAFEVAAWEEWVRGAGEGSS